MIYTGASLLQAVDTKTATVKWTYSVGLVACPLLAACGPAVADGVVYIQTLTETFAVNASTGALLWDVRIGVNGSSPAVANGVVYVGSSFDNNLYALDAGTGAVLWQYTTGAAVNSSPVVANGMVFTGSEDGNVYAFHLPGH